MAYSEMDYMNIGGGLKSLGSKSTSIAGVGTIGTVTFDENVCVAMVIPVGHEEYSSLGIVNASGSFESIYSPTPTPMLQDITNSTVTINGRWAANTTYNVYAITFN